MIINTEQFEKNVSLLINKEVSEIYSFLFKDRKKALLPSEGLDFQMEILRALHRVTEEATLEIACGLLMMQPQNSKKVPFYDMRKPKAD